MINHFKNGQVQEAASAHRRLLPLMKALFTAPNPAPVKAALNINGVSVGGLRLPLLPLTEEEKSALQAVLPASKVKTFI
jgi:4-hydroxy-tetrahydrodipicolinate synthase